MRKVDHNEFIGKVFGYFTVESIEEPLQNSKKKERKCVCRCVCGNIRKHNFSVLRRGSRQSCGCMRGLLISKTKAPDGPIAKHRIYNVYLKMIRRCYNEKEHQYKDYGGRGITVCDEWRNDRYKFIEWAFHNGWRNGLQLDRKDNDMGYSPSNCRFVTPRQNSLNRRNTILLVSNGQTKSLSDWCIETGLPYRCLYDRYKKGEPASVILRPSGTRF